MGTRHLEVFYAISSVDKQREEKKRKVWKEEEEWCRECVFILVVLSSHVLSEFTLFVDILPGNAPFLDLLSTQEKLT